MRITPAESHRRMSPRFIVPWDVPGLGATNAAALRPRKEEALRAIGGMGCPGGGSGEGADLLGLAVDGRDQEAEQFDGEDGVVALAARADLDAGGPGGPEKLAGVD